MSTIAYDPTRDALYRPERRETIFERGKAYSPLQLAVEAARLAYFRAEKSDAEQARLAEALGRVGFADLGLFSNSKTGAAGFGARRSADGVALLAFRGTQPDDIKDLLADASAKLVPWGESAGQVHEGFAGDVRALKTQIDEWFEKAQPDPWKLIVTGHSLGAAMGTLAATIWQAEWLFTLGSPRVGNAEFTTTVAATKMVRLVDCSDIVTRLPPPVHGYEHVKGCTYLTRRADVIENPDPDFVCAERRVAGVEYMRRYAWKFWRNVLLRSFADHAPINYARAFF